MIDLPPYTKKLVKMYDTKFRRILLLNFVKLIVFCNKTLPKNYFIYIRENIRNITMSFDVNIGRSEPAIKAATNAQNNGGSGGNLGYMMSGGGGGKQKKDDIEIFETKKQTQDIFESTSKIPSIEPYSFQNDDSLLQKIIKIIAKYFKS